MEAGSGLNGNASGVPLVIIRTEGGFKVYSPAKPSASHLVSGDSKNPHCTCSEYANGTGGARCAHIVAVLNSFGSSEEDRLAVEERRAIQDEGCGLPDNGFGDRLRTPTRMLVKRSVSPDGRIDSLSIEFSAPVDEFVASEVADRAARLLALQSAIVRGFLDGAKNGNGVRPTPENRDGTNGAALAEMVNIGGMDGKWGRRLFINLQANGQSLKLFGNKTQLADAIRNAGFPRMAERIEEGVALRAPCRVITKPSPDGKYVNVERVLPLSMPGTDGRGLR
jgi:hypothetical protein